MARRILTSAAALWAVTACSLGTAGYGLAVSWRAQCVIENFQSDLEALRTENVQLREELAKRVARTELVVSVSGGEFAPKTLAQRNRNWANVKSLDGDTWKGQIGTDKFGHAIFEAPEWSIRACALTLKAYERKHGIRTVEALVDRFCENNKSEYVRHLCRTLGVRKDEPFSFTARLPELVRAIVKFECGETVGDAQLSLMAVR